MLMKLTPGRIKAFRKMLVKLTSDNDGERRGTLIETVYPHIPMAELPPIFSRHIFP